MESKRLRYLDRLRVLVVFSLIPFHAALTYLRFGTVYIKEPVSGLAALPFLIVTTPVGDFFMTLMFFISGVASYYSFGKRGARGYVRERLNKLLLPFCSGFCLSAPLRLTFRRCMKGLRAASSAFSRSSSILISCVITLTATCGFFYTCSFSRCCARRCFPAGKGMRGDYCASETVF
jgi:uncharacterized membrane protein